MTKRFCKCGGVVGNEGCKKCARHFLQTTAERGYDSKWRRLRATILDIEPLCRRCAGVDIATPAIEVHHIQPISVAPHLRLDPNNLMPLCVSCHDREHDS